MPRTYSGAYSRRRYSNASVTNSANGVIQKDPNNGGVTPRYSINAYSTDPNMGVVQITVLSEVVNVNAGTGGADFSAVGGTTTFAAGTVVEVYAKAKPGYRFVGWNNAPSGKSRQANPMRVTLNQNVVMSASFAAIPAQTRTINVNWNDTMGRVQANGLLNGQISGITQGAMVTLNANPNPGYHLVKWTGGPANGTETTPNYTFQVSANYNITAVFAKDADSPVDVDPSGHDTDDPFTPNYGGGGGGGTTDPNPGTGTLSSGGLIDQVKPFVKKWWWAILIVAYILYKEGGSK